MGEQKIRKVGTGNSFYLPSAYIKLHDLDKYVYYLEVSKDGKTITYKRMRELPPKEMKELLEKRKQKLQTNIDMLNGS